MEDERVEALEQAATRDRVLLLAEALALATCIALACAWTTKTSECKQNSDFNAKAARWETFRIFCARRATATALPAPLPPAQDPLDKSATSASNSTPNCVIFSLVDGSKTVASADEARGMLCDETQSTC